MMGQFLPMEPKRLKHNNLKNQLLYINKYTIVVFKVEE